MPENEIVTDAVAQGKEKRLRGVVIALVLILFLALVSAGGLFWYALEQRDKAAQAGSNFAEKVQIECEKPRIAQSLDMRSFCDDVEGEAEDVVEKTPNPIRGRPGVDGRDGVDGADGVDGRDGRDGKNGRPGKDGVDGEDGLSGDIGPPGPQGPSGPKGEPGADGFNGEKGDPGDDATFSPITLQCIDKENQYISKVWLKRATDGSWRINCLYREDDDSPGVGGE